MEKREEQFLWDVIKTWEDCAITFDQSGKILGFSCNISNFFSSSPDDLVGQHYESAFSNNFTSALSPAFHILGQTHLPQTFHFEMEQKNERRYYWGRLSSFKLRDETMRLLLIIRDVSSPPTAEKVFNEQQVIYQLLTESSFNVVLVESLEGQILYASPSIRHLSGYTPDEILRQERKDFIHPDDYERLYQVGKNGGRIVPPEGARYELRVRHKSGNWVWVECEVRKIDWNGKPASLVTSRNISQRVKSEERLANMLKELEEARQRAEAANRVKSEFIAGISHDLRTPLHGLLGMAELLAQTHLTEDQQEYLAAIQESGDTLLARLNDLLDLSKIESSQLDLQNVDFSIVEAVEGLTDILGSQAAAKNLLLFCHVHPEVPPVVRGDPQRLRQVLINLIGNAIKFTQKGEVDVRVTRLSNGRLRFWVRDTGPGIDPKLLDEGIWGRDAARSPNRTRFPRKKPKMGIGLTISMRLVELMGDTLKVKSKEGMGSTFYFDLPLPASERRLIEALGNELSGKRILATDENATNRQVIREILEQAGAEVELTSGGVETIRNLLDNPTCDCVILSANLPDLDGLATAAMIRANRTLETLPIVLMISSAEPDEVARCKELKVNAILTKPVGREMLVRAVHEVMTSGGFDNQLVHQNRNTTILVVEDNEVNLRLARDMLQHAGYSVVSARDGTEALKQLERHVIDAVLMDIQLPDMDGIEATTRIRHSSHWSQIPIIAMTAHAMKGDAEQFLEAGVDSCLAKPVNQTELLGVLEKEISRRKTPAVSANNGQ